MLTKRSNFDVYGVLYLLSPKASPGPQFPRRSSGNDNPSLSRLADRRRQKPMASAESQAENEGVLNISPLPQHLKIVF